MKKKPDGELQPDVFSEEEQFNAARKKAMNLLLYADRTEQQLREKLLSHDFPQQAIDDAVAYVKSYHYLDDRRYAENFLRNRKDQKSLSEIRLLLSGRGISREILDELMEEDADAGERETVKRLFLKKYSSKDLSDPSIYQKAFRYFSGKGFRYEDSRTGMEEGLEELDHED